MVNENLIPKTETVYEIKNEIPSFEEFMKTYESDGKVSESYDLETDSYGDIRESKKSGPMFGLFQLFQVLLNTPAGPVVETVARAGNSPDVSRAVMETGRFVAEHSNEITQIGRYVGEYVRDGASGSSSAIANSSCVSGYRTLWDWWANGITGEERQMLMSLGIDDTGKTYTLGELKEILGRWWEKEDLGFSSWAREEWPYTFSEKKTYSQFLEFKRLHWEDYVSREKSLLPEESKNLISEWINEHPWSRIRENRVVNPSKSESPVWKGLKYHRSDKYGNAVRTNGRTGKHLRYFQWDYTHNDIEVFDSNRKHLGSMDPMTGEIYKGPKGHKLEL